MKINLAALSFLVSIVSLASGCATSERLEDAPAEATNGVSQAMTTQGVQGQAQPAAKKSAQANAYLFPPNATPLGSSYEDLAAAWWQWSIAIPKSENPMLGGPCEGYQTGDFFFLAGTMGGSDVRNCTIPAGKALFFPLVNVVVWNCPEYAGGSYTCEMATSEDLIHTWASSVFDNATVTLTLEVDGVALSGLEEYRAHSETFLEASILDSSERVNPYCTGPIRSNSCDVPEGSARNAAADGYWAMMRPLSAGQHTIHFTAEVAQPGGSVFALDVAYNIEVTPP